MNDKYCGEYTTYSEKIRNLLKSIESYRKLLDNSSGNSFNLDVIISIEGILEKLSHYQNNTSKICQSALKEIRNIRSNNGNSIFKKRKKQLNFTDFNKIKSIINEVIDTINEELPKEEDLDAIEIDLINKKYSNKPLGEAIRNHAREIVYVLCSEDNAKNIIIEPTIGKKLEELLRYLKYQRINLLSPYSTTRDVEYHVYGLIEEDNLIRNGINHSVVYKNISDISKLINKNHSNKTFSVEYIAGIINSLIDIIAQNIRQEKKCDKIQELILSEQFPHLERVIACGSRKIAQIISKEMQLEENQNSHNGKTISKEDGVNR